MIGTDPARAARALRPPDRPLQLDLVRRGLSRSTPTMIGYQAPPLDGIWATAPYLHNGSVPTLAALLKSSTRPAAVHAGPPRPTSRTTTRDNVGWKFEPVAAPAAPDSAAARGPLRLRHLELRPRQRRPHLRRQAQRRRADGPDRVPEDSVTGRDVRADVRAATLRHGLPPWVCSALPALARIPLRPWVGIIGPSTRFFW